MIMGHDRFLVRVFVHKMKYAALKMPVGAMQ
jgi:hypothetical protein